MSLFEAIGYAKALDDTKLNIFATSEKYIVAKDVSLHVITTPAMINGKKSIKTEIEVLSKDGKIMDTISSEGFSRKEFNEQIYLLQETYDFKEFEIAEDKKDAKEKMEGKVK